MKGKAKGLLEKEEQYIDQGEVVELEQQVAKMSSAVVATLASVGAEEGEDSKEYLEAPFSYEMSGSESVSLANGSLQYTETDFLLPGKNGFDLEITRQYDSYTANKQDMTPEYKNVNSYTYVIYGDIRYRKSGSSSNKSATGLIMGFADDRMTRVGAEIKAFEKIDKLYDEYTVGDQVDLYYYKTAFNENSLDTRTYNEIELRDIDLYAKYQHKVVSEVQTSSRDNSHYKESYGLGYGWRFRLPSMEVVAEAQQKNNITYKTFLHLADGRTLEIKNNKLKDYELKDVAFSKSSGTMEHSVTKKTVDYQYKVSYKNGHSDYFQEILDSSRKVERYELVVRKDHLGNTIFFSMSKNGGMSVTDSWGREVKLVKSGGIMTWTLPDGKTITYTTDGSKLTKVVDQENRTTSYDYTDKSAESRYCAWDYLDESNTRLTFQYLTAVVHPSGLRTEYTYSTTPVKIVFDRKYQGFYQYYAIAGRKDIAGGKTYNSATYSFKEAETEYIETANVIHSGNVHETHSFNKKNQCTGIVIKHGSAVAEEHTLIYGTKESDPNYKLLTKETRKIYGSGGGWVQRAAEYTYTADKLANLAKEVITWTGSNGKTLYTQTVNMEYGVHSVLTKREYTKEGTTKIAEVNTVNSKGLITQREVQEGGTVKERTKYTYDNNIIKMEQRFYNGLKESVTVDYTYGNYSPLPVTKTITGVKAADGSLAFEDGKWMEKAVFDSLGRVVSVTDSNGNTTGYTYDGLGRVIKESYPDGKARVMKYDDAASGNSITTTDENGNQQIIKYTPLGKVMEVYALNPQTLLKSYAYNGRNLLESETTYNGSGAVQSKTTYTHDLEGRILTKKTTGNNLNIQESYSYDNAHGGQGCRIVHTLAGDGNADTVITTTQMDVMGNTLTETTGGNTVIYAYDQLGNRKTQKDAKGNETKWKYDHAGRVVEETNAEKNTAITTYDELGRKKEFTDFKGLTAKFTYDILGRLTLQETPFEDNYTTKVRYTYDPNGNVVLQEQLCNKPGMTQQWRKTVYKYDKRNRVTDAIVYEDNGSVNRTYYEYDSSGNILRQYVGAGESGTSGALLISYTYDRFSNQTKMTGPDGVAEFYAYDDAGFPINKTDRNGNITTYTVDGAGRILTETVKDKAGNTLGTAKRTYTATGQTASEDNGTVSIQYKYNNNGLLSEQTETGDIRKEYAYDACCNRTSFKLYKGNAEVLAMGYDYDDMNRLDEVRQGNTLLAKYGYDKNGNRASLTNYNGNISVDYIYNNANLVTKLTNNQGGKVCSSYSYTYYLDGNQASKTDNKGTVTSYNYDSMGRLKKESETGGDSIAYTYDRFHNRTKMVVEGTEPYNAQYSYNNRNQLLKEIKAKGKATETTIYTYDANGNQILTERQILAPKGTARGHVSFKGGETPFFEYRKYNGFDQLVQVQVDNTRCEYSYRPDGLRHSKAVDGNKRTHLWDGQNMVAELNANGNITGWFLRGIGLLSWEQDGNLQHYLHNAHGDVVQRMDGYGNLLRSYYYDAFGVEKKPEKLDSNPFRYCGEYFDAETGTVYLRARYYDARTGRFGAEDAAKDGLNWYTYCGNSPIIHYDPTGRYYLVQEHDTGYYSVVPHTAREVLLKGAMSFMPFGDFLSSRMNIVLGGGTILGGTSANNMGEEGILTDLPPHMFSIGSSLVPPSERKVTLPNAFGVLNGLFTIAHEGTILELDYVLFALMDINGLQSTGFADIDTLVTQMSTLQSIVNGNPDYFGTFEGGYNGQFIDDYRVYRMSEEARRKKFNIDASKYMLNNIIDYWDPNAVAIKQERYDQLWSEYDARINKWASLLK